MVLKLAVAVLAQIYKVAKQRVAAGVISSAMTQMTVVKILKNLDAFISD